MSDSLGSTFHNHLLQREAAGPAIPKCFCVDSLVRIRYFISVAAWLIPAIIHFLCGSELCVLKRVSISIRCLLLLDINTCFGLSLEVFYLGLNAGSSQELQKDIWGFTSPGLIDIPGLPIAPQNLQANLHPGQCPPWFWGLFPGAVTQGTMAALDSEGRWCLGDAQWGGIAPGPWTGLRPNIPHPNLEP